MSAADAHRELARAIQKFHADTSSEYVAGWVLVTHKMSVELEAEGASSVGVITAPDQSWVLTRGLLEIARDPTIEDDDE